MSWAKRERLAITRSGTVVGIDSYVCGNVNVSCVVVCLNELHCLPIAAFSQCLTATHILILYFVVPP